MLTVTKTIISTVLLSILLAKANTVEARLKYYRYNDNIPMVEMSLNMMVAMGVLEQIPSRLVHDGNPYNRMVTAKYDPQSRSRYGYPVSTGYHGHRRYNDYLDDLESPYDRYYSNRFAYAPYRDRYRRWGDRWNEPWYSRWGNQWNNPWSTGWSDPWHSPWGGIWNDRLNNPGGGYWNNPWGSAWSNQWMNPWSNPWSTTIVNPYASPYSGLGGWPYMPGYPNLLMSPNTLFESDQTMDDQLQSDPSSVNQQPGHDGYTLNPTSWSANPATSNHDRDRYRSDNRSPESRLNGLWIGDNGEMLGIRGGNFLWYDGNNRYANGKLIKTPTMMEARAEGSNMIIRYHYGFLGDELVTMSRKGKIRTYSPMPLKQSPYASGPHAAYSNYRQYADGANSANANDESDLAAPMSAYPDPGNTPPVSAYADKHNDPARADEHLKGEGNGYWGPLDPVISTHSRKHVPASPAMTDRGASSQVMRTPGRDYSAGPSFGMNRDPAGVADIWNSRPAETAFDPPAPAALKPYTSEPQASTRTFNSYPVNKHYMPEFNDPQPERDNNIWKPLSPYSNYAVNPDMASVNDADDEANESHREPAGADKWDPNTYLYSYMKDNDYSQAPVIPYPRDNSNIWLPSGSYKDNEYPAAAPAFTAKNDSSNIWKPGNTYADRRRSTEARPSYYSTENSQRNTAVPSTGTEVRKFVWSESAPWN